MSACPMLRLPVSNPLKWKEHVQGKSVAKAEASTAHLVDWFKQNRSLGSAMPKDILQKRRARAIVNPFPGTAEAGLG